MSIETLKKELKDARGAISEKSKYGILNFIDSLKAENDRLKTEIQMKEEIISAKDDVIQTQAGCIETQKELIETQKLLIEKQPENYRQFPTESINAEEKERKRCIVIARFPESTKETPSERMAEDTANVKQLIDEMKVEACVVETFRMGTVKEKKAGEKAVKPQPRLLKVRLQTSAQAKAFLSNAKNIKDSSSFKDKKILLRKSLSAEQRKFENDLFKKQKARVQELQQSNHHQEYTIYAGKICIKVVDKKPEVIRDPLNELKYSKVSAPSAPTSPLNTSQSFHSSLSTPSGKN